MTRMNDMTNAVVGMSASPYTHQYREVIIDISSLTLCLPRPINPVGELLVNTSCWRHLLLKDGFMFSCLYKRLKEMRVVVIVSFRILAINISFIKIHFNPSNGGQNILVLTCVNYCFYYRLKHSRILHYF